MISLSLKTPFASTIDRLCVAPENIRHGDDADADIDALGQTLLNGQVDALFVRKSRAGEQGDYAILDGRRRYLAYKRLIRAKTISSRTPVNLIECTTPEEIAAATVVRNTARMAVTDADVLLHIHRMSAEFKTADEIGKVLGLSPAEVRRKQKLGSLDERLLKAFKAGKVKIDVLKAIARITNPMPEQWDKWAKMAQAGNLHEYEIRAGNAGLTINDRRLRYIDLKAYSKAGGRIEQDLFGEIPDRLLDGDIVDRLWLGAMEPTMVWLRDQGLTVTTEIGDEDGFVELAWNFKGTTPAAEIEAAAIELRGLSNIMHDADASKVVAASDFYVRRRLHLAHLKAAPLDIVACEIGVTSNGNVNADFYVRQADLDEHVARQQAADPAEAPMPISNGRALSDYAHAPAEVPGESAEAESGGFTVTQHHDITTTAGKALALSLADHPAEAFDALLATMFRQCLLNVGATDQLHQLLRVQLNGYRLARADGDDPLLKPLIDRAEVWLAAFKAADLHPVQWVGTMDGAAKGDLLAIIVALQVDTAEGGAHRRRSTARTEAAHVAAAIGHDVRTRYRPDAGFYAGVTKAILSGFVTDMGEDPAPLMKLKRGDMAAKVFALATTHDYVPPHFSFTLKPAADDATTPADQVAA